MDVNRHEMQRQHEGEREQGDNEARCKMLRRSIHIFEDEDFMRNVDPRVVYGAQGASMSWKRDNVLLD